MKVFVTGHLGFIGPCVIRRLVEAGHEVTAFDTGYFNENTDLDAELTLPHHEINKDIRDIEAEDIRGHDAVIHMAGLSNDPLGKLQPALTEEINYLASRRTANFAKAEGVERFVFFSSCSLYGVADTSRPVDETAEQAPVTAYAKSKVATENLLREIADDHFSPVYLRNATCYGVSARPRFDLVLNNLTAWGYYTKEIRIMSDGLPWRPMVHIDDVAQAAVCAIEADREIVHNQAFNVGQNSENFQVKDLAEIVHSKLPGTTLAITGETGGDDRSYRVDFTKIENKLPGFKPNWTVDKGAEEIIEWCRHHDRLTIDQANDRNYVRLRQIEFLLDRSSLNNSLKWA